MKNLNTLIILALLASSAPLHASPNEGKFEPTHIDYRILLITNNDFQSITQHMPDSVNFRPDGRAAVAGKLFKKLDEGKLEAHFEQKRELDESDPQPVKFSPTNKPSLGSIQLLTIEGDSKGGRFVNRKGLKRGSFRDSKGGRFVNRK